MPNQNNEYKIWTSKLKNKNIGRDFLLWYFDQDKWSSKHFSTKNKLCLFLRPEKNNQISSLNRLSSITLYQPIKPDFGGLTLYETSWKSTGKEKAASSSSVRLQWTRVSSWNTTHIQRQDQWEQKYIKMEAHLECIINLSEVFFPHIYAFLKSENSTLKKNV